MTRAIGIIRVSKVGDRQGESFASPAEQRQRIESACERDGLTLVETFEELDVSGGKPLAERPGLSKAVEAVEAGQAEVIAAAYFDRLFRSLGTQAEVLKRVEEVGGRVMAVDVGQITNASAGQWLSGTVMGTMAEYYRRSVRERTVEAQRRCVARGALPWPVVPAGYRKGSSGVLEPDSAAPVVAHGFQMRLAGHTVKEVRAYLNAHGVAYGYHGVCKMLKNRIYLGELRFGQLVNLTAHEAIVSREGFDAVQRMVITKGRPAKSHRLLARQRVLRCGTCGHALTVNSSGDGSYPVYRCPPSGDCPHRVTISAERVEAATIEVVKNALANVEGRASAERNVRDAEEALVNAQRVLDEAIMALGDLMTEPAAIKRLGELSMARNAAQAHLDQVGGSAREITVTASGDWDRLTLSERRDLIRAMVQRIDVFPGRSDRIRIQLLG